MQSYYSRDEMIAFFEEYHHDLEIAVLTAILENGQSIASKSAMAVMIQDSLGEAAQVWEREIEELENMSK